MQLRENEPGQDGFQGISEYTEDKRLLVACIVRIKSVANFRRKGRDDLRTDVRRDALQTLHHSNTTVSDAERNANSLSAVRTLAIDVVESFIVMREYLREVENGWSESTCACATMWVAHIWRLSQRVWKLCKANYPGLWYLERTLHYGPQQSLGGRIEVPHRSHAGFGNGGACLLAQGCET